MDEAELIADARRGDLDSFNRLVLAHQSKAYNLAYRITGDSESAADATQEAFLAAYRNLRGFRGGSFRAWLLRIVTNACYDELRRRKRRPADSLDTIEDDSPSGDGLRAEGAFGSVDEGPEASAERADVTRAIKRCLERLPQEFRTVVVLADVLALDYTEVASAMGSPVGTVRSRLARARARLRECLEASRELSGMGVRLAEGIALRRTAHPGEGIPKGRAT